MICRGIEPADLVTVIASGLFEPGWYVNQYPDVAASGADPLEHFMTQGWIESRSPGPHFDTAWYISQYSSEMSESRNPLVYFLSAGWRLGHRPTSGVGSNRLAMDDPESLGLAVPPIVLAVAREALG